MIKGSRDRRTTHREKRENKWLRGQEDGSRG